MAKNRPLYERVYMSLLHDIQRGVYPPGSQVPTEAAVAEAFGVSRITSKRALSQLAEEGIIERIRGRGSFVIGGVPGESSPGDMIARANASKPICIGFLAQDIGVAYGMGIFSAIEEAVAQNDWGLMVRISRGDARTERQAIDSVMAHDIDGLIVFPVNGEQYNPTLLRLHINGFPVVLVDRHFRGIDIDVVCTDGEKATETAVSYLIELGHRHIALLSPPPEHTSTIEDRIKGYVSAFTKHHMATDHALMLTDFTTALPGTSQQDAYQRDREVFAQFLKDHPYVTAVFTVEYHLARVVASVAESQGIKVPEDLSIVCFDSPPVEPGHEPFFTHVMQDEAEMGRRAVQLLHRRITASEEAVHQPAIVSLEGRLIHGQSTAAVRNQSEKVFTIK